MQRYYFLCVRTASDAERIVQTLKREWGVNSDKELFAQAYGRYYSSTYMPAIDWHMNQWEKKKELPEYILHFYATEIMGMNVERERDKALSDGRYFEKNVAYPS